MHITWLLTAVLIQEKDALNVESFILSFCPGAGVQQRTDWCPFQAVKSWHHFRPLFLLQSWGRCCSLWGLPDCRSHLPQSHLGNFLWGLAANCHRTASTTYSDFQVKLASVVTQIVTEQSVLSNQNTQVSDGSYFWLLFQGLCHWSHFPLQCFRAQFWRCSLWWVKTFSWACSVLSSYIAAYAQENHTIQKISFPSFPSLCSPLFHLCHPSLSAGFPQTLTCTLFNTSVSLVPMTFALRVLGDGLGSPSVTSAKQATEMSRNNWEGSAARGLHARPVEFTVTPAAGSVRAMSDVNIKVC